MMILEDTTEVFAERQDMYKIKCACGALLGLFPEEGTLGWVGDQDDQADWPHYWFDCIACGRSHKFGRFAERQPWWDKALTWARAWNGQPYLGVTQEQRWAKGL